MKLSFLDTLRAGPPPPKVALLSNAHFFTRVVPVAAGATAAEAAAQVELALEAISPFPLTQLYYGWFWPPGADQAFVFASYRRRFTAEQSAAWADSDLVLPAFAALLGGTVQPATTVILASPDGLTALHWETAALPTKVLFRPLAPEATDEERALLREELIRDIGGSKTVIDLASPPQADPALDDRETVLRSGDFVSRLPVAVTTALDVRDKAALAQLRGARSRDVILWRVALGCAAALALLFVGEFALIGGKAWQKVRVAKQNGQQPRVEKILDQEALAHRVDELTTKRLLPMEMLTLLVGENGERKPADIFFVRVVSASAGPGGIYTLTVDAKTNNLSQIAVYQSTLESSHLFDEVKTTGTRTSGAGGTFTLTVTVKPSSLKSGPSV